MKNSWGICSTYFAARTVYSIAEGGTFQAVAGKGGIRTIAGHERSRPFTRPRPGLLAATRQEREVDSATDDGTGNPQ